MRIEKVRLTRESYSAGDDADAPHEHFVSIKADVTPEDLIYQVYTKLDSIQREFSGTRLITSNKALAVTAVQYGSPRLFLGISEEDILIIEDIAYLHFCIYDGFDPDAVFNVVRRIRTPYISRNLKP